jgi:hypothetical protein
MNSECRCHISCVALGLAIGVMAAVMTFLMGFSGMDYDVAKPYVDHMQIIYRGHSDSIVGLLIASGTVFIYGFIKGVVIAWLYNFFNARCASWCCKKGSCDAK